MYVIQELINIVLDVNECGRDNGGCEQVCNDNKGQHECSCRYGFILDADMKTCNGKDFDCIYFICFLSSRCSWALDIYRCLIAGVANWQPD